MAKQSFKDSIYQQIANSQVQQVIKDQRDQDYKLAQDLIAQYQPTNDDITLAQNLIAQYQQPTPQPEPVVSQPQVPVLKKQTSPTKEEKLKAFSENYARQQQEESMLQSARSTAEKEAKREAAEKAGLNWINSKDFQNTAKQGKALQLKEQEEAKRKEANKVLENQLSGKPVLTDEQEELERQILNADRYVEDDPNKQPWNKRLLSKDQKNAVIQNATPETVDRWLSPETKLTEREKGEAKAYASAELQKFNYGPNKQPLLNTPEERQHYADMVNLINKTNAVTNYAEGVLKAPFYNLADMISDAGRSLGDQFGGLGAAITDKLGITEGATQRHNERAEAADKFFDQNEANMRQSFANAQTQNPMAFAAGQLTGQMGAYMLTNPVFDGIAEGAGITSQLGKFFVNQGAQNAQDLVLDTAPLVRDLMQDGTMSDADKREVFNNILLNALGNAAFGTAQELPTIMSKIDEGKAARQAERQAFTDNIIEGRKALDTLINEDASKQIPKLPEENYATDIYKNTEPFSITKDPYYLTQEEFEAGQKRLQDYLNEPSANNKELTENYIKQNSFGPDIDNALNDIQSFIDGFSGEKELHKELTDSLDEVKNAIRNGGDIEGARAKLDNALNSAAEIVQQDNDSLLGDITSEAFKKVKSATDGSVIRLNKSVLKDALGDDAIFSDLNNMVYTGKGSIKFREGSGVPIDSIYNELRELSDYELPEAHTEADQVAAIAKYISDVKAKNITPDNSAINEVKRLGNSLDEGIGNYNPNKVMAESANFNKPVSESIDPEEFESIKNGNYYIEEKMPYKGAVIEDGKSRVVTNSAINADIIDADQLKNDPVIQEIAKYQKHKNDVTFAEAMDRVSLDGNKWKKDYINGVKTIDGDTDVDTVMLLMQDINKKLDKTTNQKTIERLTAQKNTLLSKLREYGTKSGQGIQAFAKWNDTADGALLNAQKVMDDAVKNWGTTNVKQHTSNSRIAKALADMGHKNIPTEKPVLDHDQIKSGIIAELEKEFGSIDSYFNDEDIEFLTNLAEDKSIPLWQITDEIEHKLKHGTFYPIEKEVVEKFEGNSRLANILKSMGDKTTPETKAPLSHDEIKKGIINELQREFADMEAQFTDSDIEFLTRLVEDKSVKNWQIADEISHKLEHGTWYSLDESLPENTIKNTQVSNILDNMYKDKKIAKPKKEMTIGELLTGIKNSFEADPISSSKNFTDDDYYFVAQMLQNKVPRWQIEDELLLRIEHGTWYTLDESIAQKPVKNKQVSNMLDNIINGKKTAKAKKEMTIGELLTGIKNAFEDEPISTAKKFTDDDYYFLAQMMQENVPRWKIEDELAHRIQHGEWYTLDESLPVKQPTNTKLQKALNSLVGEQVRVEKPAPSLAQIREEVKNTLDKEFAELDETARLFGDDDIDYLANLINNGASQQDIATALDHKLATGKFGISTKTMRQVNDIFKQIENYDRNSRQFVEGQLEAYRLLANEVVGDATAMEKFEAWRYLAMLGNPKTMLRNFVGNALFNVVTDTSNSLAAVGEAAIDKGIKLSKKGLNKVFNKSFDTTKGIQRTKSLLNPFKDNELIKAAFEDADASRYRQMIGSKYEKFSKDTLRQQKSVFNSKLLQLYEKATDAGISDYTAVKSKYTTSLAGYLKANGLDKSVFEAETKLARLKNLSETRLLSDAERNTIEKLTKDIETLEKGRDYALKQAEYATFHEDNAIANWLSKTSKEAPGPLRAMIEGIVPFKKTPANVLKNGLEYSPLGAIDSIKKTGKLIYENTGKRAGNLADTYINSKGKEVAKTFANDVIESWSKTLTGTGLTALGFYLFNKGVLLDSNKDTKYQDQLEGLQNYSIKIGDKTYTVDWAAPAVMPLLLGAEMAKVWTAEGKETEQWYEHLDEYLNAANMIAEPIIETSMLQGVRDTLKDMASSAKTGDYEGLLTNAAYQMGAGYLSQGIPTISGQIARTADNTRRSAYTDKEGVAGTLEKQGRKIMNKIPGLSRFNQPYVDTYGREQKNSPFNNPVGNLAYQMLSPGYLADVNTTDADRMSRDVYGISKNKSMLPEWQSYFTDSDGKRVSPENYTKAAKAYGQAELEIRNALANDDWFNGLEGSQKEEIVKGINTIAEHVGKSSIDPEYDKDSKAFKAYKENGINGLLNYYKSTTANSTAGVSAESNAAKDIQEQIEKGNTDAANYMSEQSGLLPTLGLDSTAAKGAYTKAYGVYGEGYSAEEFAKTYKAIDKDHNQSLKKNEEVIPYMNSQNMSYDEGMKFWKAFARTKGKNPWKVPVLENGKWK